MMTSEADRHIAKRSSAWVLVLMLVLAGCGRKGPERRMREFSGFTMGTTYSVKVVVPAGANDAGAEIENGLNAELSRIDRLMSVYNPESEISRFNDYSAREWFPVSLELARVISKALEINRLSQGAFDITVGPLVDLWGFGSRKTNGLPSRKKIAETMQITGSGHLRVRLSPPALKKLEPRLKCNLSAIAKGFGVDSLGKFLESAGFHEYMVEIGGEVRVRGLNISRIPWRIGISFPDKSGRIKDVLELKNRAMATSGDYFNYFEYQGKRYSHTIDPATGWPVVHNLTSVSVVARDCMTADAYATAILVMGPERGYRMAVDHGIPALLIIREGDVLREIVTPDFRGLM